jgi:protein-arginine kinase activator protein McsA
MSELTDLLDAAVEKEDYREAAKIRDEISKRE